MAELQAYMAGVIVQPYCLPNCNLMGSSVPGGHEREGKSEQQKQRRKEGGDGRPRAEAGKRGHGEQGHKETSTSWCECTRSIDNCFDADMLAACVYIDKAQAIAL